MSEKKALSRGQKVVLKALASGDRAALEEIIECAKVALETLSTFNSLQARQAERKDGTMTRRQLAAQKAARARWGTKPQLEDGEPPSSGGEQ